MKSILALAALAATAVAAPTKLDARAMTIDDYAILQYALTLEHLEDTFYAQNLAKFSNADFQNAGYSTDIRDRVSEIGSHEASHVAFLTGALSSLGQSPVKACSYNFGVTGVQSFLATAAILEGVGVSAYLGAAAFIMDKTYLTAAGSILTVEARHTSFIRNTIGEDPFPKPYDVPLGFNEVYSLASAFITSCPSSNVALPVKAFPALTAKLTDCDVPTPGKHVKLTPAKGVSTSGTIYAAFIGFPTNQYGVWNPATMTVTIPEDAAGQTYVVLTSSMNVTDDSILAGPTILEVPLAPKAYA